MNQSPDIATNLVNNPGAELQQLMSDPRTSDEARAAVSNVASVSSPLKINGPPVPHKVNKAGDGRLQIVNENQEFTLVTLRPFFCHV